MVKLSVTFVFIFSAMLAEAQVLDFGAAEKLPGNINSNAEESSPLISPQGDKLFFTRAFSDENTGGKYSGSDVWISDLKGSTWTKANEAGAYINNKNNSGVVGISADGNSLYLLETSSSKKVNGIYISKQNNGVWQKPQFILIPGLEGNGFSGFYLSPDFDVIIVSMKRADTRGEEDLYISVKNSIGSWDVPKNLGPVINTTGFEISPFLSANKKRLYFASNGHPGEGDADIFYCDKLYDSWETWSAPRNAGTKINSKKFDAYFSIYGDTLAYFSSNRDGNLADIYKAKVFQGDEVYAISQRYLSETDMNDLLGEKVSRKVTFEKNIVELNGPQKELLYFIVNKLTHKADINFHIVVSEENDPSLSSKRQTAVYDFLRQSGIENHRIQVTQGKPKVNGKAKNGVIEIILFK